MLGWKKKSFVEKKPNSNLYQRHEVFEQSYNQHVNSYTFGRILRKWGAVGPGTVEGCNPGDPELHPFKNELQKNDYNQKS